MWYVLCGLRHVVSITTVLLTIKTQVIDYQFAFVATLRPDHLIHEFVILGATSIEVIVFWLCSLGLRDD